MSGTEKRIWQQRLRIEAAAGPHVRGGMLHRFLNLRDDLNVAAEAGFGFDVVRVYVGMLGHSLSCRRPIKD